MKDISEAVKRAIFQEGLWPITIFPAIIDLLETYGCKISFWNEDEKWASILVENTAIGYLWQKYPILIILNKYLDEYRLYLRDYNNISIIGVKKLESKELKLESNILKDEIISSLDYENFSAEDLWFYTNS